jgi:hypothetical protein
MRSVSVSKKPKQSRHRVPTFVLENALQGESISERYQGEVDASVAKLERRYAKAQKALEAAERRAEKVRLAAEVAATRGAKVKAEREHSRLLLLVEDRRQELKEIEKLMMPATYMGRDRRRRVRARHETGAGTIQLGGG